MGVGQLGIFRVRTRNLEKIYFKRNIKESLWEFIPPWTFPLRIPYSSSRWMVEPTHLNQKRVQVKFANHFLIHKTYPRFKLERKLKVWWLPKGISSSKIPYCWWFCGSEIRRSIIYKVFFMPGSAGFLPSTIAPENRPSQKKSNFPTTDFSQGNC